MGVRALSSGCLPGTLAVQSGAPHASQRSGQAASPRHARGAHERCPTAAGFLHGGRYLAPAHPQRSNSDSALGQAVGLGDPLLSGTRGASKAGMRPLACLGPQETLCRLSDPRHFPPRAGYKPGAEQGAHMCPAWPGALDAGSPEAGVCSRHSTTGNLPLRPERDSA